MKTIIFSILILALSTISYAQEYEGIVKVSNESMAYNGIVVGEGLILTTSDNTTGEVTIEFYGDNHRVRTSARPIKRNENLNLCLLQYTKPVSVKVYRLSPKTFYHVDITGWNSSNTKYLFMDVDVKKNMILAGYPRINASGFAILNNNELVGIQVYKNKERIYCVWYQDIKEFIKK